MVYKACFSCELLFEVDEGVEARCPECGGLLEDYQAEEGGLPFDEEGDEDGFNEPTAAFSPEQLQRLTEGDSISETSTYEGFSARVRANVAQHNESAFSSRAPEPTTALKLSEVEGGAFSSRAPEPTTALKLSEVEGGAFSSRAPEPTTALKLSEVEGGAFSSRAPEPTTALKLSEVEGHPAPASPFAAPAANPFGGGSAGDFSAPTSPSNAAPPIQRAAPSVSPSALDKAPDSP